MTVYGDLLFLLGAGEQVPAVWLTLRLCDLRRRPWIGVLFCFACGGARIACLCLPSGGLTAWILPAVLALLCFRGKTLRGTGKNLFCYGLVSGSFFAAKTCLTCLFGGGAFTADGYLLAPFGAAACAEAVAWAVGAGLLAARRKGRDRGFCLNCEISVDGLKIPLRCYYDSGNFLTDPGSGLPVVIVEYRALRRRFPGGLAPPMSGGFAARFSDRYREIGYRSISGKTEKLSAFAADGFYISGTLRAAVVAVTERPLEARGRFDGILGPDLWEGIGI